MEEDLEDVGSREHSIGESGVAPREIELMLRRIYKQNILVNVEGSILDQESEIAALRRRVEHQEGASEGVLVVIGRIEDLNRP
jgi:hypothetical protein